MGILRALTFIVGNFTHQVNNFVNLFTFDAILVASCWQKFVLMEVRMKYLMSINKITCGVYDQRKCETQTSFGKCQPVLNKHRAIEL